MSRLKRFCILTLLLCFAGLKLQKAFCQYENDDIKDERKSEHKSGSHIQRNYWELPVPPYDKLDPQESKDYYKTLYSPYALLRIPRPVRYEKTTLKAGYYLVKLVIQDPRKPAKPGQSFTATVPPPNQPEAETPPPTEPEHHHLIHFPHHKDDTQATGGFPDAERAYRKEKLPPLDANGPSNTRPIVTMLIKEKGGIELALPATSSVAAPKPAPNREKGKGKHEKTEKPKGSTVEFVFGNPDPVNPQVLYLKYCLDDTCYQSVPLQPALMP